MFILGSKSFHIENRVWDGDPSKISLHLYHDYKTYLGKESSESYTNHWYISVNINTVDCLRSPNPAVGVKLRSLTTLSLMLPKTHSFHDIFTLNIKTLRKWLFTMKTMLLRQWRDHHDRDCMVVGFTTTYAISAYHHWCCEFESRWGQGAQHYVIKFVSDLQQVGGFLRVLRFPPPLKLTATI